MIRIFFLIIIINMVVPIAGGTTPIIAAAEKKWEFGGKDGMASAWNTAQDGRTRLDIGCNHRLGQTVAGSLNGYTGNALTRIDENVEPLIFEIEDVNGKLETFKGDTNYFAPDQGWAFRKFPLALLDAFGKGRKLTLRNGKGAIIAQFNLEEASSARTFMKNVCGF